MNRRELYEIYRSWGFHLIALHPKSKQPVHQKWHTSSLQPDEIDKYNWGLVLGENFVDVDIDELTLVPALNYFLDQLDTFSFAHDGLTKHYIFRVEDKAQPKKWTNKLFGTLVEIRTGKQQTMIPPSIHPSGNPLVAFIPPAGIKTIKFSDLVNIIENALVVWAILPFYNEGVRQDIVLRLTTALYRAGKSEDEIFSIIEALCNLTNDNEIGRRFDAVKYTLEKLQRGEPTQGLPSLKEFVDEERMEVLQSILKEIKTNHDVDVISELVMPASVFVERKETVEFIIPNLFARGSVSLLAGEQKSGKTILTLDIIRALLYGELIFGEIEAKPVKVLLVEGDMPNALLNWNLKKLSIAHPDLYILSRFDLMKAGINLDLSYQTATDILQRAIEHSEAELMFIDTISSFHTKNENQAEEMKPIMQRLVSLAEGLNIHICFIHHTRKRPPNGQNDINASAIVGTSVFQRFTSANYLVTKEVDNVTGKTVHRFNVVGSWFKPIKPFTFTIEDDPPDKIKISYSHLQPVKPRKLNKGDEIQEVKRMLEAGASKNEIVAKFGVGALRWI